MRTQVKKEKIEMDKPDVGELHSGPLDKEVVKQALREILNEISMFKVASASARISAQRGWRSREKVRPN